MPEPDLDNAWRAQTPGTEGWPRSPRPGAVNKYFIVSADCHVQEPDDFLLARMDAKYRDRLPGIVLGGDGAKLQKSEGFRPLRLRNVPFACGTCRASISSRTASRVSARTAPVWN